jgi:hypothetical protein
VIFVVAFFLLSDGLRRPDQRSTVNSGASTRLKVCSPWDSPMSFKRCPNCRSLKVVPAVETGQFIYFRCSDCVEVWSIPERRDALRSMTDPAIERDRAERRRLRFAVH